MSPTLAIQITLAVSDGVQLFLSLLSLALLVVIIVSLFSPQSLQKGIVGFFYDAIRPLMRVVQRVIPPYRGIDFSPIVIIIGIRILQALTEQTERYLVTLWTQAL